MAQNTLGRNLTFPIYNADGTSFHNLVLHKAVVDSVVMSLGDKITGDVYYKDNALDVTMHEYIMFKRNPNDENEDAVKYVLVSPPTIVREGMVSDNSELKGMTKYSFVFYHPMYVLNNIPFSDVAVTTEQERYLSQNKEFSWIGYPDDFIAKVNKNLQQTQWTVEKSSRFPNEKDSVLSGVLSFSNNTIADALKTWYDTWEIPYVIDVVKSGEQGYSDGKRFKIVFGLPSTEIYAQGNNSTPFVFQMGKGLGLKNNSRTPRNNKIITRISGYGSESNIPYGYPQIIWTGNQEWDYTINNASGMQTITVGGKTIQAMSYPIYDGIVGGQKVRLIKHPFTRTHLMPTVYSETVNKKVNPLNPNYNPNGEILDYYDAVATQEYPYVNEIDPSAPSYESHEFADIKPELDADRNTGIVSAVPLNADLTPADHWDDSMDDNGKYLQEYFKITLPQLTFDLYACAAITQEMQINMRSGACIGCTFPVQVDWDDYKKNFYDSDGNFLPDGKQRDLEKYPKSNLGQISVVVQKDNTTFGTLMPNIYQQPKANDLFVFIGISLPLSYITSAEARLDDAMKSYMLENNVFYFDYPLKFDEYFLATHTAILSQIKPNAIVHFAFGDIAQPLELYVKQLTIKYEQGVLPQYDITLTDNIEVVLNQIGQVADDVERLSSVISMMREGYSRNVWTELAKKLSKTKDDTANGLITFLKGIHAGDFSEGVSGSALFQDIDGNWHFETDFLNVRKKFTAKEVAIQDVHHVGGQQLLTAASADCEFVVERDDCFRCFFLRKDKSGKAITNKWRKNDQAYCCTFNLETQEDGTVGNRYYWMLVTNTSNDKADDNKYTVDGTEYDAAEYHYIDLSKTVKGTGSETVPKGGDAIVQLGYQGEDNKGRQTAILIAGAAADDSSPFIRLFSGINTFTLPANPEQIKPGDNRLVGVLRMLQGSTLADGRDINSLGVTRGNLLMNSGFTGEYESEKVEAGTQVNVNTTIFSEELRYWNAQGVSVADEPLSASGKKAIIDGSLLQSIDGGMSKDEWYIVSFRAKVTNLSLSIGGLVQTVEPSTEVKRYDFPFRCSSPDNDELKFEGKAEIFEPSLMLGNLPTEWNANHKDNDKALAEMLGLEYLKNAISEASTSILGGLVLSQIIKVGNYRNGKITEETGGMSGIFLDKNSPFTWGGGTLEKAIYTIKKYADKPQYQPTEEELSNMAQYVVTHGGRAILNDVILRGYIYALGGEFNGTVYAHDGQFSGRILANGGSFCGEDGMFKITLDADTQKLTIWGPDKVSDLVNMTPTADARQVEYITIGKYGLFGTGQSGEYYVFPQIELKRDNNIQGTDIVNKITIDIFNGLTFLSLRDGEQIRRTSYTATGAVIDGDFLQITNLPNSSTGLAIGQIWNDNGVLKIKT